MNPAYQPYLNAHRARARLALALKERGWEIFGYTEGDPDARDQVNLAHWHGYAKHPDYPDVIVVCGINDSNEQVYRRLDWPDKFKANWANGWYYHIEFEGKYKTMGSGTSWAGDMSEQGKASVNTHADYITERAQKYIAKRAKDAEKAAKRKEIDARKAARLAKKQAKEEEKAARAANKGKGKQDAGQAGTEAAETVTEPAEGQAPLEAQEPQEAPKRKKKEAEPVDPADLVVLPPVSPLIVDKLPVVIDALVTNMVNRPAHLPEGTSFEDIAAAKIAEFYGFDAAKTTDAARQLAALLEDPDVTNLAPGLRNNALRARARDVLH